MRMSKKHYTTAAAVLTAGVFSGGISWHCLIVPAVLLIISAALNLKNLKFSRDSLLIMAVLLSGVISSAAANADKQNAIHEFMKIIIFALAFYAGTAADKKTVLNAIILTGAAAAVSGIMGYCNILRIDEFVFNDRTFYRLQSFIKYANITAVVLGCAYFALIDAYGENSKPYIPYVGACLLTAFYLTISKAAIPLFLIVGAVWIALGKKHAGYFLLQNFICIIFAAGIILLARKHYYSIALIAAAAGIAAAGKIGAGVNMSRRSIRLVLLSIAALGAVSVAVYAKNTDIFATLISRFIYSRDALKLLKDNPILGIGAGGWRYYQYGIQSTGYSVNYVHNGVIQLWLDYGIAGFAGIAAIFAGSAVRAFGKKEYTLLCMLLFILLHAALDIDFNAGIILVICGLITGQLTDGRRSFGCKPFAAAVLAASALFVCYSCAEYAVRSRFESAYLKEDYQSALRYAHALERLCPADSKLKVSIAALDDGAAEEYMKKAVSLSPLDMEIYLKYINYKIDNNLPSDIYEFADRLIGMAPKQETTYVKVRDFAGKAYKNGLCSLSEYERTIDLADRRMEEERVINRNKLLGEITK